MTIANYSTLGRSGLRVSRLALGTMTFGTESGWGADKDTARALFDAYVEAGGNVFDTADFYTGGTSEIWLGEFVAERGLRDKAVISTKFTFSADPANPNAGGNGRKNMMRAVEASLKRLGTDYIDLYLMHAWDRITPVEEVMRGFDDLVSSGKVRHVGLSDVPAWYASRAQTLAQWRGWEPLNALQLEYSLTRRSIEDEFVPLGLDQGMGVMAWAPLANGFLSGKYRPSRDGQFGEGRMQQLAAVNNPAVTKFSARNFAILAELERVADEIGRPMAQVALNWAANRPGIATVIIGATKLVQIEDNLKALDFVIPAELATRLEQASAEEKTFPYNLFSDPMQVMLQGTNPVSDKPESYARRVAISGPSASVSA